MKFTAAGQEKCKDLFNCFVKKNNVVKRRKRIVITYRPLDPDETEIRYSFYAADTTDVLLVTEPGVTKIGSVVLQTPDTLKGLDRDIEVSLYIYRNRCDCYSAGCYEREHCTDYLGRLPRHI